MSRIRGLLARLRDIVAPSSARERMDDEFRFHLAMETEKLVRAGVAPEEAGRRAAIAFGGVQRHHDEMRDAAGGVMGDIARDIRLAGRALRRAPGFTLAAVSSLALGFLLATSVIAVVNAYLARSLPYPSPERLYHLRYGPVGPVEPRGMSTLDWSKVSDVVEAPVSATSISYYLNDPPFARSIRALSVSPGFVSGLGLRVIAGRSLGGDDFSRAAGRPALIGYSLWRERFGGDSSIIGSDIRVERESGRAEVDVYRVVGIITPGFWFGRSSSDQVDILTPATAPVRTYVVRLREGVTHAQAQERLTSFVRNAATWLPDGWQGVELTSMHDQYMGGVKPLLRTVTVAAALVLVLTGVNVAILLLLRTMRRQREVAVRVALGAGNGSLARMFLSEIAIVCSLAVGVALLGSMLVLRFLGAAIETQLGKPAPGGAGTIGVNPTVFLLVGGVGVLAAILLAAVPVMVPWRRRLSQTLRGSGRSTSDSRSMHRLRFALVTMEIAGSLALLTGGGLMIRSAMQMSSTRLGIDTSELLRTRVVLRAASYPDPAAYQRFYLSAAARIAEHTGGKPVFGGPYPYYEPPPVRVETAAGIAAVSASEIDIGPRFFSTVGVPLRVGREFVETDLLDSEPVAIVSESAARALWPNQNPIGQRVRALPPTQPGAIVPPWRTVVGVASDIRQAYDDQTTRDIYFPLFQRNAGRFGYFYMRFKGSAVELAPKIREAINAVDPRAMVTGPTPVIAENRRLAEARFMSSMLAGFSAVAAVLAMLGIYGVIAYAVQQRARETAIRLAGGAARRAIIRLFVGSGASMLVAGFASGLLGAIAIGRLLSSQLFGVGRFDPFTLSVASVLLGAAALVATFLPAHRAASRSPVVALTGD